MQVTGSPSSRPRVSKEERGENGKKKRKKSNHIIDFWGECLYVCLYQGGGGGQMNGRTSAVGI